MGTWPLVPGVCLLFPLTVRSSFNESVRYMVIGHYYGLYHVFCHLTLRQLGQAHVTAPIFTVGETEDQRLSDLPMRHS